MAILRAYLQNFTFGKRLAHGSLLVRRCVECRKVPDLMPKTLNSSPSAATSTELRAQADHARDLANALSPRDETARRLRQVADELEAKADARERQTPPWG